MGEQFVTINDQALHGAEQKISSRVSDVLKMADIEVESQEAAAAATEVIKRLRSLIKSIEEERQSITRPINEGVKALNGKFKGLTAPLEQAERALRDKLSGFFEYQKALQQEAERKALEQQRRDEEKREAERAAARALAEHEHGAQPEPEPTPEPAQAVAPVPALTTTPAPAMKVRADSGALSSMRKTWKYRVLNVAQLAQACPEAVTVNHQAVMDHIRNGVRVMPGLEIYESEDLVVR